MQFIDLNAQYAALRTEIDANIGKVLAHGSFIMGPEVNELETQLREYVGTEHCVTCANGTDALQMLFMSYGIGAGDAVFCPDVTFFATVEPACLLGATPVLCDIEADTYNLNPLSLERQIKAVIAEGTLRPRMVVAVDFLGAVADYKTISTVCEKYGLILIEDAAQSFGAEYKGQKAGSFGHSAITSFFPAKPLGCFGDGGAIFTNDHKIADFCRSLRTHGKGPGGKYDNIRIGMNSRLDTLQAAVLLVKLWALKNYEMKARQKIAERYNEAFENRFITPFIAPGGISAWAQYALLAEDESARSRMIASLNAKCIPNMIYYPKPLHALPIFSTLNCYGEEYTNAKNYCARTFSLPMHPYLDAAQQDIIIDAALGGI